MKVTGFCDGKVQAGRNLFRNLQTWLLGEWTAAGQMYQSAPLSIIYCDRALQKTNAPPSDGSLMAEDIGFHSVGKSDVVAHLYALK